MRKVLAHRPDNETAEPKPKRDSWGVSVAGRGGRTEGVWSRGQGPPWIGSPVKRVRVLRYTGCVSLAGVGNVRSRRGVKCFRSTGQQTASRGSKSAGSPI